MWMQLVSRIFYNKNSTLFGLSVGTISAAAGYALNAAGCNFDSVPWYQVATMLGAPPAIVGALLTDNGKQKIE